MMSVISLFNSLISMFMDYIKGKWEAIKEAVEYGLDWRQAVDIFLFGFIFGLGFVIAYKLISIIV
jgi:hypothetical protein